MYEEYKQAAYDTLSKLAVYTELARRINENLSQIHSMANEDVETGYSPKDLSFRRYVRVDRTISFPEWFSLVFGVDKEVVLRSINISGIGIVLRTGSVDEPWLPVAHPSVKSIIMFSFLDDYVWKRIMGNVRWLDSGYRSVIEHVYGIRDALRGVLDREEKINEDYSDILRKRYNVDERLLSIVANAIELALSRSDWASFTTTSDRYRDDLSNVLLETRISLVPFISPKSIFLEQKYCDREVSIPQEIDRGQVIKRLNSIEVSNTSITLYISKEGYATRHDNIPMTIADYAYSIRNLILAHYMFTDEDWKWIYDTMIRYLRLTEIAKKKISDAYIIIKMAY